MDPRLAEKFVGYVRQPLRWTAASGPQGRQKLLDMGYEAGLISEK